MRGSDHRPFDIREDFARITLAHQAAQLRQRFGALLREQVGQTVSSEVEVEEEIRYLISVMRS